MDENAIVLQFNVQCHAQNFKMLCLGVAYASYNRMTERQLIKLVQIVNSGDWHITPGQWIKIVDIAKLYEMRNMGVTGWSISQLSEIDPVLVALEDGSKKWELRFKFSDEPAVNNPDSINHPNHYVSGRFEVIDIIEEFCSSLEGRAAFDNGNAIKYILRWQRKNGVEDLKKAIWYIQDLIKQIESEENNNETTTDN